MIRLATAARLDASPSCGINFDVDVNIEARKWVCPDCGGTVKTLKIVVDYELCEANALCMQAAPEVFAVDGDDRLHLLQEQPPESAWAKVEKAVRLCPKGALRLERNS
jgi:ferredoxin